MANSFGKAVWSVDTVITNASLMALGLGGVLKVQGFFWDSQNSGLAVAVNDGSNPIWSANSTAAEQNIGHVIPKAVDVDVPSFPTISGGTLFVYIA